jgi:phosphate transport system substrate-binding protein
MRKILNMVIAAAIMLFAANIVMAKSDVIEIKGSDTLINMVQVLAESYMKGHPGISISVTGGGSGTGIAALTNKRCDIANSSRSMKAKEIEDANNRGIDPKRIVVAIDALSLIVNANNPIEKLTVDEIGKIYRGDVKNWKDIGGSDTPIALYGRQSNSGTYDFMKESVLKGEYSPSMKAMNGNAQIVEAIKQDAGGVGYVGVGYVQDATGIKVLDVASSQSLGYFSPLNLMNIKTGNYPITRPLNQYVNGAPKGIVKDFIEFELSREGQNIVEQQGFYSPPNEYRKYNCDSVGVKCEAEESSVVKYSAQGRDGN